MDAGWGDLTAQSPKQVTRAYSIANRPEDRGRAVFNIRLAVPPGIVSSYLFSLKPDDAVGMSGPYGPPMMISAVIAMLLTLGVERHSIFNDDFGS